MNERSATVVKLGLSQTLAWGSSYYLPAILANPIAADLAVAPSVVFGAFSLALVVSGVLGPLAGRLIDRHGGRAMLGGSNLVFAAGLAGLGLVQGTTGLFAAWLAIGIAMSAGLYGGAFSTLVGLYGKDARNAITGVTLFGGFASTIGWPLTTWLDATFGWRDACFGWAALHLLVALPLNAWLPARGGTARGPASVSGAAAPASAASGAVSGVAGGVAGGAASGEVAGAAVDPAGNPSPPARPLLTAVLLSYVFAATWIVSTAMAAHLPRMMQAVGAPLALAVTVGALVGPAQVAGRLLEFGLLRRLHPLFSARVASLGHPIGAIALFFIGAPAAAAFALLHGAGNGIMTIAKGTLPLALFGPVGYGQRQGLLTLPAQVGQAFAPLAFGLALDHWGAGALWVSAAVAASAFVALMLVPRA